MKKYYFKEKFFKITDHYPVLDENKNEVYFIDQDFTFFGYKSTVSDKDGKALFNIDKKIFSLFQTFYIDFANGDNMEVKSKLSFLSRKIDIDYNGEELKLSGNLFDLGFEIRKENEVIGRITKTFFALTDTYELEVIDEKYELPLIALTISLNNMKDTQAARANSSAN